MSVTVHHGDMLEVLPTLGARFHAVITDPPYHLASIVKRFGADGAAAAKVGATGAYARASKGFMGKQWDGGDIAFRPETWAAVGSVMLPGAHLVAFAGTKGAHRMACAIEDAGFEIRDTLAWLYGGGFPKSHDVSKGIDKRRDDLSEIDTVREWLEKRRQEAGLTRKAVNEALGVAGNGGGLMSAWTTNKTSHAIPQWEQWLRLKTLLGFGDEMDAEVWRLNGRKGTPGEAWNDREFYETPTGGLHGGSGNTVGAFNIGRQAKPGGVTDAARAWEGWGTALKPAYEPIVLARWPMDRKTVAANVLAHGTGAINVDACRVGTSKDVPASAAKDRIGQIAKGDERGRTMGTPGFDPNVGRWPANVVHDGSEEVIAAFPQTSSGTGAVKQATAAGHRANAYGAESRPAGTPMIAHGDSGSAARFFYSAKADKGDRLQSKHPTVKPVDLMRWLVRMVTPKGGHVLDPFAGSGTTGMACMAEGFDCHLIEREAEYVADIRRRIAHVSGADAPLFAKVAAE